MRITPAMSRILENDDEYVPSRRRTPGKRRRPATNPSIRTIVNIARALGTTVGDLLGEPTTHLSPADRQRVIEFARYLTSLLRSEQ